MFTKLNQPVPARAGIDTEYKLSFTRRRRLELWYGERVGYLSLVGFPLNFDELRAGADGPGREAFSAWTNQSFTSANSLWNEWVSKLPQVPRNATALIVIQRFSSAKWNPNYKQRAQELFDYYVKTHPQESPFVFLPLEINGITSRKDLFGLEVNVYPSPRNQAMWDCITGIPASTRTVIVLTGIDTFSTNETSYLNLWYHLSQRDIYFASLLAHYEDTALEQYVTRDQWFEIALQDIVKPLLSRTKCAHHTKAELWLSLTRKMDVYKANCSPKMVPPTTNGHKLLEDHRGRHGGRNGIPIPSVQEYVVRGLRHSTQST